MIWDAATLSPATVAALYIANRLNSDLIVALAERWLAEGHDSASLIDLAFDENLNLHDRRACLPKILAGLGVTELPDPAASLWELNRYLVAKVANGDERLLDALDELYALDENEDKPDLGFGQELYLHMRRLGTEYWMSHSDTGQSGLSILLYHYTGFEPERLGWNEAEAQQHIVEIIEEAKRVLNAYYHEARRPKSETTRFPK